jgi:hypothetical protein
MVVRSLSKPRQARSHLVSPRLRGKGPTAPHGNGRESSEHQEQARQTPHPLGEPRPFTLLGWNRSSKLNSSIGSKKLLEGALMPEDHW